MFFGDNVWLSMGAVLATFGVMFLLLKLVEQLLHPHPELIRKLMHVGMGLVVISFPWLFHRPWPVLVLTGVATCVLAAMKLLPSLRDGIGTVLTGVHRASFGEVSFPIAVGLLFLLSDGDKLLYAVPMLIVTLADTVASLIGIAYGRVRYLTSEGLKSAEGSIAFFSIAFLSVHVPLLLFTDVGRTQTLLIAIVIGILSTLLEAIAWRGLDNLLIPLGAFAFLRLYLHASSQALLLRLGATVSLLIFGLAWRRRTNLNDSALMACALFGYGVWMLAGPTWLLAPALLFLAHAIWYPRAGQDRTHTVYAVASVTLGALLWIGLHVANRGGFLLPYAVCFGTHLALNDVSYQAFIARGRHVATSRLVIAIMAGWALAAAQLLVASNITAAAPALPLAAAAILIGSLVFRLLTPILYSGQRSRILVYSAGFIAGTLASFLAQGAQMLLALYST